MLKRNNKAGRSAQRQRRPAAADDDRKITALKLKPEELTPEMAAYFAKCDETLGFVPNVLKAYAFDMPKLSAFVAMYNDLMLAPSGLSKPERKMIAVAVSAHNRCYYCLVAHGAAVRQLSDDPPLGELMVMNYRAARLSKRERVMLDFAVKLTAEPWRFFRAQYLGYRRGRRLLQHDQSRRIRDRHAAEFGLSQPSALRPRAGA